jgi:hypothetical protein
MSPAQILDASTSGPEDGEDTQSGPFLQGPGEMNGPIQFMIADAWLTDKNGVSDRKEQKFSPPV